MGEKKKYIIDTSTIVSGKLNIWENDYIYPDSVIKEIRSGSLEKILEVADIKTCSPDPEYIKMAGEAALKTGDYHVLSSTDIDVIALAIELNGIIITDDYAIQNVARYCGIEYTEGGIMFVLIIMVFFSMKAQNMVETATLAIFLSTSSGVIGYFRIVHIDFLAAILTGGIALASGYYFSILAHKLDQKHIYRFLGIVFIIVVVSEIIKIVVL